jgi:ParB family chromosome partitioning protein
MTKVRYKEPKGGMSRMVIEASHGSRASVGMTEVKGEIYYLSHDLIIPYKNQARKNFSEDELFSLISSIQRQGIIQPLQIIQSTEYNGKFEVVSGERRLRAAKKLGLEKVPCMILDKDRDANEIALIENIQRESLHPIELADAIALLLNEQKHGNQSDIAEKIGISKQKISHLIAISRLPMDVKECLLKNKEIKITFLKNIAYLEDEDLIRNKVFKLSQSEERYKSILRISSNGELIRFDQLKIEKLSQIEKNSLKLELNNLISKIS